MPEESEDVQRYLRAVSRAYRLQSLGLKIDGVKFDLTLYPWLIDIIDSDDNQIAIRKGAQLGFTSAMILRSIDQLWFKYPRGLLYLMPGRDDVSDFSKSRFDRILKDNAKQFMGRIKDVDAVGIKAIGNGFLYLRGSRSRTQLKSIPVDEVVFDERDEMEDDNVALALTRLDGSAFANTVDLSTPTFPGFGVDERYNRSDQRKWFINCKNCGTDTCLEDDFPDIYIRDSRGNALKACRKCKKQIYTNDGRWMPTAKSDISGFYISQLNSPTVSLTKIINEFEDPTTNQREFYNSRLGMPFADVDDCIDEHMLRKACRDDPMALSSRGPCFMGVDIGKNNNFFVVGERRSESHLAILKYGELGEEMGEISEIAEKFNVMVGVMDAQAETRTVREFLATNGGWFGLWYSEAQRGAYDWNLKAQRVNVNRTEVLDQVHNWINLRRITLPRPGETFGMLLSHMTNLVRTVSIHPESGQRKVRWIVKGRKNDHLFHAMAMATIAAEQSPVVDSKNRLIRTESEWKNTGRSFMSA